MQLKRRVNPGSTAALHTGPVEVTQTSITTHTEKFILHMTFVYFKSNPYPVLVWSLTKYFMANKIWGEFYKYLLASISWAQQILRCNQLIAFPFPRIDCFSFSTWSLILLSRAHGKLYFPLKQQFFCISYTGI